MNAHNTTARVFGANPFVEGMQWTGKWLVLSGAVFVGSMLDCLQEVSVAVIVIFVSLQGFRPFLRFTRSLVADRKKCRKETDDLKEVGIENAKHLRHLDTSQAGSVLCLANAIHSSSDRLNKKEAGELFLAVAEQEWDAECVPIATSAQQAPILGVLGSLLGLMSGIGRLTVAMAGDGPEEMQVAFSQLFNAMGTMVTTTLAGCAGALLLSGLAAISHSAVQRHIAELRMIAALMGGATADSQTSPIRRNKLDTLFGGRTR